MYRLTKLPKNLIPCPKSDPDSYKIYTEIKLAIERLTWEPVDLEDIKDYALKHNFCPYYALKDRLGAADIILMPYNYLIDEKIRNTMNIDWVNSIIIIDEAHNIAQATEEITSFNLNEKTLLKSNKETDRIIYEL